MTTLYLQNLDQLTAMPEPEVLQPAQRRFRTRMEWLRWLMECGISADHAVKIIERMGL